MSLIPFLGPDGLQSTTRQQNGGVIIRIYLLRQTSVRIYGQSAVASRNIGEGGLKALQSLPSSHHTFPRPPLNDDMDTLDWDGALRCNEDITVPGFSTSQISVKVGSSARALRTSCLPFVKIGLDCSVDHSATTTQVSLDRRKTSASDTTSDRSVVKRCGKLAFVHRMIDSSE